MCHIPMSMLAQLRNDIFGNLLGETKIRHEMREIIDVCFSAYMKDCLNRKD